MPVLLAATLGACSSGSPAPPSAGAAPAAADLGARLYNGNCVACHQQSGGGIPGVYPSLAGSPLVLGDPLTLARWVVYGDRPASLPPGRYVTVMPHFGWMTPEDTAALLSHVRSSFGNHAPPVRAEELRAVLDRSS